MLARWVPDVSFDVMCLAFAVASPQLLTLAHCFKTLGTDPFGDLLGCQIWSFVFCFAEFFAEMCADSLASGC